MSRLPVSQIAERFYRANQSWYYERIVRIALPTHGAFRSSACRCFKVGIRRNAYDDQSWLRGWCFDPVSTSWQLLVDRPILGAVCADTSYTRPDASIEPFRQDEQSILKELREIVGE